MKRRQCSGREIHGDVAQVEAGATVGDAATLSGVSKVPIHRWQARYPDMARDAHWTPLVGVRDGAAHQCSMQACLTCSGAGADHGRTVAPPIPRVLPRLTWR